MNEDLREWQKELLEWLLLNTPNRLHIGRGRRSGWTTVLSKYERLIKDKGWLRSYKLRHRRSLECDS